MELKGIKKYMYTCFKKIGDALGVSIPPCGRSLDKDVSPPQPPARDPNPVIIPSSSTGGPRVKITPR